MILICYDGSPDSQRAVDHAAALMPAQTATVLTVWEPFIDVITRSGAGAAFWPGGVELEKIDAAAEQAARERAAEGTSRARKAGLEAEPRTCSRAATIAETILHEADAADAEVIVLGTRGLTGLKSLWLGSVSHGVVQHADRPVMVVPSADAATARKAARRG